MAAVFYSDRRSFFVYPIFIAITALARLIVLQGKEMAPESILFEAISILVLTGAAVVITRLNQTHWSGPANSDSVLRCIQPERMDARVTKRQNFSDQFKAAVALEALRGDKTVQEIAAKWVVRAAPVRQ